jgi:hypothetical protein
VTASTPLRLENRPGLAAIAYRIGKHASFMRSMLAALGSSPNARLSRLLTRENDDFTITLLDAWATTLDVLTFYQERTANEYYLRTATERLSLLQLARMIGYELRPGVAASTALAFTIEDAPGALPEVALDIGVKVQSVPGPGEQPQVFETVEKIAARGVWNAIRPRQTSPQILSASAASLWVRADANLKKGDALLIVAPASGGVNQALRRVGEVKRDDPNNRAQLLLEPSSLNPTFKSGASETGVWALRVKAAPFGHNAPLQITRDANGNVKETDEWPLEESSDTITLDAVYDQVTAGSWAVIDRPATPWYVENAGFSSRFAPSLAGGGFAARIGGSSVFTGGIDISIGIFGGRKRIFAHADQVRATSRATYGISGRGTQLTIDVDWTLNDDDLGFARDTAVFTQSEPVELVEAALAEAMPRNMIVLDGDYGELAKGRLIAVSGRLSGSAKDSPLESEIAEIAEATTGANGMTTLKLTRDLANTYRRSEMTFNANVARATHGETVRETLGSGDSSRPYQRFTLKSAPLTYTSAANASGSASTLEVRVNDLLWREVPTLYGRGPRERVYVTRTSDEGKTTVQFGDGTTGARPPSGSENVRAAYRKGSGTGGNLEAGQLSMLMSRPLGLKGALNPQPATGGVDAEQRDEARQNAPLTVMTLDRIVSLRDYEDFARAFRGVAKALATWTWDGRQRGVFMTIAGADGAEILESSATYQNLVAAMRTAGDPYVPLRVQTYRKASFTLTARITRHPDYLAENVERAVRDMLAASFSFAARGFGQPVALSEVMAAIQQVAGVVAVDIDTLQRTDGIGGTGLVGLLPAARPQAGLGSVQPAELLVIDETNINLSLIE